MAAFDRIESGIPSMDKALDSIRLGDNVAGVLVCGIPGICPPFARQAIRDGRKGIEIIEAAALRDHIPDVGKAKDE